MRRGSGMIAAKQKFPARHGSWVPWQLLSEGQGTPALSRLDCETQAPISVLHRAISKHWAPFSATSQTGIFVILKAGLPEPRTVSRRTRSCGSRLPRPYHFRARIQSFQAVAAPFPGDSRSAVEPSRAALGSPTRASGRPRAGREFQARRKNVGRAASWIPAFAGNDVLSDISLSWTYSNNAPRAHAQGPGTTCRQTSTFQFVRKKFLKLFRRRTRLRLAPPAPVLCQSREVRLLANLT